MSLSENWERKNKSALFRFISGFRRKSSFKDQLQQALREVRMVNSKLSFSLERIKEKDKKIFGEVIRSIQEKNTEQAVVYASELSELRKVGKFVTQAQVALDFVATRIETVLTIGELTVSSLIPLVSVIKQIQEQIAVSVPEARTEIQQLFDSFSEMIQTASPNTELGLKFETANEEAEQILDEAEAFAERKIREEFPEVPVEIRDEELTS